MIDLERRSPLLMSEVQKEDCLTVEQAAQKLSTSKQTVYSYCNFLRIRKIKFPLDRKVYISLEDVERIRQEMQHQ